MKNSFLIALSLSFFSLSLYSQGYSSYYINANVNANVNHTVNGVIYENKTITNIDYGALSLANAQNEKNKIELQKITDQIQKNIALEIAENPSKAYDYGYVNRFNVDKNTAKINGFKSFTMNYIIPNNILFNQAGAGRYQNISKEGIITEITFFSPAYNKKNKAIDLNSFDEYIVGQETEILDQNNQKNLIYCHKKDLNRSTTFGLQGYKSTLIWEDKFEFGITDNYSSYNSGVGNGYSNIVKVRVYGDKDDVTFEQLEGRRYYFSLLIQKIISTATISNEKY
jgi:hypothetical protein